MRYSVQPRDRIFVKANGFLIFAKNMGKNIGKNISKNVNGKYILDHTKQPAADVLNTASKRVIQKTAEATGNLIGSKIATKIKTKISKNSPQNNLERCTNQHEKEITKERYISAEEIQKIINDLRLI